MTIMNELGGYIDDEIRKDSDDKIHGGLASKENVKEYDVDQDELKKGINIEMEHTDDESIAKEIALDHLSEIPDYYTRLIGMENDVE